MKSKVIKKLQCVRLRAVSVIRDVSALTLARAGSVLAGPTTVASILKEGMWWTYSKFQGITALQSRPAPWQLESLSDFFTMSLMDKLTNVKIRIAWVATHFFFYSIIGVCRWLPHNNLDWDHLHVKWNIPNSFGRCLNPGLSLYSWHSSWIQGHWIQWPRVEHSISQNFSFVPLGSATFSDSHLIWTGYDRRDTSPNAKVSIWG